MAIMYQGQTPDPRSQEISQERIEIIGDQHTGLVNKEKEKQPDIVFSIETRALIEQEPNPFHPVLPWFQGKAHLSPPAYEQYIKPHFYQCIANPVHALIGGKVIGDGNNYTFQRILNLSAKVRKINIPG